MSKIWHANLDILAEGLDNDYDQKDLCIGTSGTKPSDIKHHLEDHSFNEISKPAHYNHGSIEPIDVIEDWKLPYHLGNVLKYIARAEHKDNRKRDLEKAAWYLQRHIKNIKE